MIQSKNWRQTIDIRSTFGVPLKTLVYNILNELCGRLVASKLTNFVMSAHRIWWKSVFFWEKKRALPHNFHWDFVLELAPMASLRTQGWEYVYGGGSWVLLLFSSYSGSKWDDSLNMGRATKNEGWQLTLWPLWNSEIFGTSPLWLSSPQKLPFTWPQKGSWLWLSEYDENMLVGYLAQDLQQCHWQAIIHPSHTRNWESKSFPRENNRTPRLLAAQFRQIFARTMTQINCRLCQFPSGEVGNLKKHIKSEHEVIIKK